MHDPSDSTRSIRAGHRHALGGGAALKRQWCVTLEAGEERVEADEVEITAAGVLVFYRFPSRRESERTLLLALSPGAWRRCELESASAD
jgi:hypothetical protein